MVLLALLLLRPPGGRSRHHATDDLATGEGVPPEAARPHPLASRGRELRHRHRVVAAAPRPPPPRAQGGGVRGIRMLEVISAVVGVAAEGEGSNLALRK